MKRSLLVILLLLLACSFTNAADYLKIDTDSIIKGTSGAEINFLVLRECPLPAKILGASNGFVFTDNGSGMSWTWAQLPVQDGGSSINWELGGLLVTPKDVDGASPDSVLTGGAGMFIGMGIITVEEVYFDILLDVADVEGEICIDSSFIPDAGTWKFSGLTCGVVPGDPSRPSFRDAAGADGSPFCITVYEVGCTPPDINVTPVGDQLVGNHCDPLAFAFAADPGAIGTTPATITGWAVTAGVGTIDNSGNYSAVPMATGTYTGNEVTVTNSCGGTDAYMFDLVFTNQDPSITNCAGMAPAVGQGNLYYFDFNAADPNACDALTWSFGIVPAPLSGTSMPAIDGNGVFTWATVTGDAGLYTITVTVDDGEGGTDDCVFDVEVLSSEPFEIQLDKIHDAYQGHYVNVFISMNKGSEWFGGFDFLVAYDASALTFMGATLGFHLDGCYEYFTYRYGWNGNCTGPCPSGMLRAVGIADINNGPNHPTDDCLYKSTPQGVPMQLVKLTFYVTNDRTFDCMYVPVRFFWHDCGDNALSNLMGDTLWISRYVYDYEMNDWTGTIHYGGHYWLGDCQNPDPEKPSPIPFIDFIHGGVDIICADSIDLRGDINLNNIANEIADAVLFTNYFIYGLYVFNINVEGQIAATDVNNDGKILTVGDLVFLVRIITGDALPYAKLSPFANNVEVLNNGSVVSSKSAVNIGAALFVFDGAGDVENLTGMKIKSDVVDGQLRVLVWSDNTTSIPAGTTDLISVSGDLNLIESSISDYYGNLMSVDMSAKVIPNAFSLQQNFPNPFNPSTNIIIDLPTQSEWKLDIYNVAGQLVKSFSGNDIGEVNVTWDAVGVASGIYFYKATAGDYTDTKKMVLMK